MKTLWVKYLNGELGGTGTSNHASLTNLYYPQSGHTGFASEGHTHTGYAPSSQGVTNGNSHDHNGGDGAQINHTTLSNVGSNTHSQIDTHISAGSPHSGHESTVNKNTANGYAPLDSNSKVPTVNLGGNGADNTKYLRGDQTWQTPASGGDPWVVVKLSQDFTISTTANNNVTNFYFTPAINKKYIIYGTFLLRTATATVGARPGISFPANLTDGCARMEASNSLTASALRTWGAISTQNAASTGLADTTNSHYGGMEAYIITGASTSGNFQITLASETAGTNVTMRAGSFFMYREI